MNKKSSNNSQVKERIKMWKAGKRWVYGALFFLGATTAVGTHANSVAAATDPTAKTPATTVEADTQIAQVQGKTVALQTATAKDTAQSTQQTDQTADPTQPAAPTDKKATTTQVTSAQPAVSTPQPDVQYKDGDSPDTISVKGADAAKLFDSSGSASNFNETGVATITPNTGFLTGQVTLANRVNMNEDFNLAGKITTSTGDGLGLGFKPSSIAIGQTGNAGGAVGIGGLPGAFGFKVDTHPNGDTQNTQATVDDPNAFPEPVLALHYNQDPSGLGATFGALMYTTGTGDHAMSTTYNGTDAPAQSVAAGASKDITIQYTGASHTMTVTYDGKTWSKDVTDWLNGQQYMSLFISASTGGAAAAQKFELDSFTFTPQFFADVQAIDKATNTQLATKPAEYSIDTTGEGVTYTVTKQNIDGYAFTGFEAGTPLTGDLTEDSPTATVTLYYTKVGSYEITPPTGASLPTGVTGTTPYTVSPITDANATNSDPQAVSNPTGLTIPGYTGFTAKAEEEKADGTKVADVALTPVNASDVSQGYSLPDLTSLADVSDNIVVTYVSDETTVTLKHVDQDHKPISTAPDSTLTAQVGTPLMLDSKIDGFDIDGYQSPAVASVTVTPDLVVTLVYDKVGAYKITSPAGVATTTTYEHLRNGKTNVITLSIPVALVFLTMRVTNQLLWIARIRPSRLFQLMRVMSLRVCKCPIHRSFQRFQIIFSLLTRRTIIRL